MQQPPSSRARHHDDRAEHGESCNDGDAPQLPFWGQSSRQEHTLFLMVCKAEDGRVVGHHASLVSFSAGFGSKSAAMYQIKYAS